MQRGIEGCTGDSHVQKGIEGCKKVMIQPNMYGLNLIRPEFVNLYSTDVMFFTNNRL